MSKYKKQDRVFNNAAIGSENIYPCLEYLHEKLPTLDTSKHRLVMRCFSIFNKRLFLLKDVDKTQLTYIMSLVKKDYISNIKNWNIDDEKFKSHACNYISAAISRIIDLKIVHNTHGNTKDISSTYHISPQIINNFKKSVSRI